MLLPDPALLVRQILFRQSYMSFYHVTGSNPGDEPLSISKILGGGVHAEPGHLHIGDRHCSLYK